MRSSNRTPRRRMCLIAILLVLLLIAAACDDDDDGADETPTTVATVTAAPTQAPPSPTPVPTVDPVHTPGPAATIALAVDPQRLTCNGANPSLVTAHVLDEANQPVQDGTIVNFSVVTLGSADPVNAATVGGVAKTTITALAQGAGVVVNVSAGSAAASARIDCL